MKYDLVFEGGGAKGMVFAGALEVFEAQGHEPGRVLGTSAGAITAALLAAGYRSSEFVEILTEKVDGKSVFASFIGAAPPFTQEEINTSHLRKALRDLDIPFIPNQIEDKVEESLNQWLLTQPRLRPLFAFIERGGVFAADDFLGWLRRRLNSGTLNGQPRNFGDMTLEQFYAVTQTDLSLIASDVTGNQMLVLNNRTAPALPVAWAVRMSMSIPLLWDEVVWRAEWGAYRGKDLTGHAMVDGGLLSNFPIELFVSDTAPVINVMGPKVSANVLGMLIDESIRVAGIAPDAPLTNKFNVGELQTIRRLLALMNTMLGAHDKMVVESLEQYVVRLPAGGYGTTEFEMSDERREKLVEAGREAMRAYFEHAPHPGLVSFGVPGAESPAGQSAADKLAQKLLSQWA